LGTLIGDPVGKEELPQNIKRSSVIPPKHESKRVCTAQDSLKSSGKDLLSLALPEAISLRLLRN
jgi:hypothetical protein